MVNNAPSQHSRIALPVGHKLQWYEIRSVLGHGGFGITYLAHDNNLGRDVALKEYLPRSWADRGLDLNVAPLTDDSIELYKKGLTSFMVEARTLAKFKHPNIVQVLMVFEQHDTAYIAMEYEQGGSLTERLRSKQFIPTEESLKEILMPILDGLQNVHDMGFLHRDIKPSNIYLRDDKSPVLIDFGSSRQTGEVNTSDVTVLVTQGYTPPEQYSKGFGQQGPWTDIYSLAASIYYTITGSVVTDALHRNAAVQSAMPDPFKPISVTDFPAYSSQFISAINGALCLKPADRPQSLSQWQLLFESEDQTEDDDVTVLYNLPEELPESDEPTVLHNLVSDITTDTEEHTTDAKHVQSTAPAEPATDTPVTTRRDPTATVRLAPSNTKPNKKESDSTQSQVTTSEKVTQSDPLRQPEEKPRSQQPGSSASKEQQQPIAQVDSKNEATSDGGSKTLTLAACAVAALATIGVGAYTLFGNGDNAQPEPTATQNTASSALPVPDQPLTLSSPLDTVREQIRLLQAEITQAKENQTEGGNSTQAAVAAIGSKLTLLANSSIVQTNEELSNLVAEGFVKSTGVTADTQALIESLIKAADTTKKDTLETLLQSESLFSDSKQQQALVFGLASASNKTRLSLQDNPEYITLVRQFKQSIQHTVRDRNFQIAARMTEIALLLQPEDPELIALSAHLSKQN